MEKNENRKSKNKGEYETFKNNQDDLHEYKQKLNNHRQEANERYI